MQHGGCIPALVLIQGISFTSLHNDWTKIPKWPFKGQFRSSFPKPIKSFGDFLDDKIVMFRNEAIVLSISFNHSIRHSSLLHRVCVYVCVYVCVCVCVCVCVFVWLHVYEHVNTTQQIPPWGEEIYIILCVCVCPTLHHYKGNTSRVSRVVVRPLQAACHYLSISVDVILIHL